MRSATSLAVEHLCHGGGHAKTHTGANRGGPRAERSRQKSIFQHRSASSAESSTTAVCPSATTRVRRPARRRAVEPALVDPHSSKKVTRSKSPTSVCRPGPTSPTSCKSPGQPRPRSRVFPPERLHALPDHRTQRALRELRTIGAASAMAARSCASSISASGSQSRDPGSIIGTAVLLTRVPRCDAKRPGADSLVRWTGFARCRVQRACTASQRRRSRGAAQRSLPPQVASKHARCLPIRRDGGVEVKRLEADLSAVRTKVESSTRPET